MSDPEAYEPQPDRTGRLVVATPALDDENFAHAVVLVLEQNEDGALGVVLNRPSEVGLPSVLPGWEAVAASPPVAFVGGPVQQGSMLGLGRLTGPEGEARAVLPGVGLVDLADDPLTQTDQVRVFAGYAGWGAGQLEAEIDAGGWFTVDADPEDVFTDEPENLWRRVLLRQGGMFRTIPENPSLN